MARAVTLGNGSLLVGLDYRGLVRDLYYPHVGHSNHVSGASGSYLHRVGAWVDGTLSWLTDEDWHVSIEFIACSGASKINAVNERIGVKLEFIDVVHNEKNVFLRKATVTNLNSDPKEVKLFFGQEFRISESRRGDTAYYDPRVRSVIHYKGNTAFLIHATHEDISFTEYSIGLFDIEGKKGTYSDAEDGILSGNNIEHGSVDSVVGLSLSLLPQESKKAYYWVIAAACIADTHTLQQDVLEQGPEYFIDSTVNYWSAWKGKEKRDLQHVPEKMLSLYEHSLVIIRNHVDDGGGVIASSDSDILNQGRDTYSYLWPRDGGYAMEALDRAGYLDVVQSFFKFMSTLLEKDGYFMHKYRIDGVLGSSWHPWVANGVVRLPIQEDETAIVLHALWRHYERARDLEFIESLYDPFIEPAADFLCAYTDDESGLPKDSYDLWEEKYGVSTYTASSVYGALIAASELSAILGKRDSALRYRGKAEQIKDAILCHLYNVETGMFVKQINHEEGRAVYDETVDISSLFGLIKFDVLPAYDARIQKAADTMLSKLWVHESGGYVRYVGDNYYRTNQDNPSNPWCIATLWVAQYFINAAKESKDLDTPRDLISWVCDRASDTGMLPEQIHPHTLEHLSTSPLVWSHAELVITVDEYAKKLALFSKKDRGAE